MRLIEEKTSIKIQIVAMVFISLVSIFLQFLDAKIKDYNDKMNLGEMRRSQYLQLASYHKQRIHFFELTGLFSQIGSRLNKKLVIEEDPVAESEKIDKDENDLLLKYRVNEIDGQVYLVEMGNLSRKKFEYYKLRIKETADLIEDMHKNPPKLLWLNIFLLQRICFVVQLIGSLFVTMLLVILFLQVSKRTKNQTFS